MGTKAVMKTYEFEVRIYGRGYGYVEAENIDEALEIIKNEKPDLAYREFDAIDYDDVIITSVEN